MNQSRDKFLEKWNLDLTTRQAKDKYGMTISNKKLRATEGLVSKYMRDSFFFTVFRVESKDQRLRIESKIISTISLCKTCKPSPEWLGSYSPVEKIRKSGLWLVNELYKEPLSIQDLKEIKGLLG